MVVVLVLLFPRNTTQYHSINYFAFVYPVLVFLCRVCIQSPFSLSALSVACVYVVVLSLCCLCTHAMYLPFSFLNTAQHPSRISGPQSRKRRRPPGCKTSVVPRPTYNVLVQAAVPGFGDLWPGRLMRCYRVMVSWCHAQPSRWLAGSAA